MNALTNLLKTFSIKNNLFSRHENQIQRVLAPIFRKVAIENLRSGKGVVARSFRGEYLAAGLGDYQDFLRTQASEGTWATDIEFASFCEQIGVHGVVTPVKNGITQSPICIYRATDNNAPTIHLYNSNNTHWYVNHNTLGNGNCLYNALAQAVQKIIQTRPASIVADQSPSTVIVRAPAAPQQPTTAATVVPKQSFFQEPKTTVVATRTFDIQHAFAIQSAIAKHPTPAELDQQDQAEAKRISQLSTAEQEQIKQDRILALKLAREEIGYTNKVNLAPHVTRCQLEQHQFQTSKLVK